MPTFATGFAGDIIDNNIRIANFSASYHSSYNPNYDFFVVNIFDTNGQQHWGEVFVPKTNNIQNQTAFIQNLTKQVLAATNPILTYSIEKFVMNKSQTNDHAYITFDYKNSLLTAQVWQHNSNNYVQQNLTWNMTLPAIQQHLGL
ncbi:hypothetical protein SAMN02746009_03623 [Hymenobacter psychrotolerans DSM 18569]|uniref:Uncharacterized protein n=2 Tax=Hymenobacter psychrotolerans TaxID=344998 RepID=A0A1M7EIM6_9BACT|nr:hypothetical protein SAMN02746009_03623 [Hymenobacter psychrotolerans DSM 18569]